MKKINLIVIISLIACGLIASAIIFGTSYSSYKAEMDKIQQKAD